MTVTELCFSDSEGIRKAFYQDLDPTWQEQLGVDMSKVDLDSYRYVPYTASDDVDHLFDRFFDREPSILNYEDREPDCG